MTQVRNYLETRLQQIANKYTVSPMFWEEVFDGNFTLQSNAVIDIWLSNDELSAVTAGGMRVIQSFGLYLDQQLPAGATHYFWMDTAYVLPARHFLTRCSDATRQPTLPTPSLASAASTSTRRTPSTTPP